MSNDLSQIMSNLRVKKITAVLFCHYNNITHRKHQKHHRSSISSLNFISRKEQRSKVKLRVLTLCFGISNNVCTLLQKLYIWRRKISALFVLTLQKNQLNPLAKVCKGNHSPFLSLISCRMTAPFLRSLYTSFQKVSQLRFFACSAFLPSSIPQFIYYTLIYFLLFRAPSNWLSSPNIQLREKLHFMKLHMHIILFPVLQFSNSIIACARWESCNNIWTFTHPYLLYPIIRNVNWKEICLVLPFVVIK